MAQPLADHLGERVIEALIHTCHPDLRRVGLGTRPHGTDEGDPVLLHVGDGEDLRRQRVDGIDDEVVRGGGEYLLHPLIPQILSDHLQS